MAIKTNLVTRRYDLDKTNLKCFSWKIFTWWQRYKSVHDTAHALTFCMWYGKVKIQDKLNWIMMTSSNGNIFRVTGPLCREFTSLGEFPAQRPVTRSFDVFFDLRPNKRLSKEPWGWWFETPSWSLWRQCNDSHKEFQNSFSRVIYEAFIAMILYRNEYMSK